MVVTDSVFFMLVKKFRIYLAFFLQHYVSVSFIKPYENHKMSTNVNRISVKAVFNVLH
jgi:hypothetical protein